MASSSAAAETLSVQGPHTYTIASRPPPKPDTPSI
jgi:hypothetical protein